MMFTQILWCSAGIRRRVFNSTFTRAVRAAQLHPNNWPIWRYNASGISGYQPECRIPASQVLRPSRNAKSRREVVWDRCAKFFYDRGVIPRHALVGVYQKIQSPVVCASAIRAYPYSL